MKKQNLADISRKSGRSVSTVSKVLRNCPGVDPETRAAVRSVVDRGGGTFSGGKEICVILPDNPKYFWHRARDFIAEHRREVTLKVYSAMNGDEDRAVLACLGEAEAEGARAVILAACPGEKLAAELGRMARERLILQLCEYTPIANTFFVGSDSFRDGAELARGGIPVTERRPMVGVVRQKETASAARRLEGFLSELSERAELRFVEPPAYSPLYASQLARALDGEGVAFDYLFCYGGLTAQAADALYKLRGKMSTRLIGFEHSAAVEKHWEAGRITALAIQHPEEQVALALALADHYLNNGQYPDRKFHYLPTEYRFQ